MHPIDQPDSPRLELFECGLACGSWGDVLERDVPHRFWIDGMRNVDDAVRLALVRDRGAVRRAVEHAAREVNRAKSRLGSVDRRLVRDDLVDALVLQRLSGIQLHAIARERIRALVTGGVDGVDAVQEQHLGQERLVGRASKHRRWVAGKIAEGHRARRLRKRLQFAHALGRKPALRHLAEGCEDHEQPPHLGRCLSRDRRSGERRQKRDREREQTRALKERAARRNMNLHHGSSCRR